MMNGNQNSNSTDVLDWMTFLGFLGSVLLGMALPFFLGVFAVHRLLPFGELNSWVYGWRAVLGILCIFVLWFFTTYITDRVARMLTDERKHPLLHEFVGEVLSGIVLFLLMLPLFTAWQAALLCSVVASILTLLLGLLVNKLFDRAESR